jgi:hypothetical protein
MSNLVVSNISDGTTSVGTGYVVNGSAKAWVNFDGTGTIATRDSFNVASLTDQSSGTYDVNFSSNMDNNDYSPSSIARGNDQVIGCSSANLTTSYARVYAVDLDGNSGISDTDTVSAQVFGDLA